MLKNRYTGYLFGILTIIAISCIFLINRINQNYEKVLQEEQRKLELFKLVDELRQSSDDLTRMARLYVIRQDTLYLTYFNQILQIRDGLISRPIEYNDIYWDYVLSDGKTPRPGQATIPLVDLIKANCKSEDAIQYFIKAKNSSDDLVAIELEAFNAMKGIFLDDNGEYNIVDKPNANYAIDLLHNKEYHEAKAKIMKSIQDFLHFANDYSNIQIKTYSKKRDRLANILLVIVGLTVIIMLIILFFIFSKGEKRVDKLPKKNSANLYSMRNIWWELRKSWQLVLISSVFSFLIVFIFAFTYEVVKSNIEDDIEQSLNTVLETTQHTIENWLLDLETEIDKFVHQAKFNSLLHSSLAKGGNIKSGNFEELIDLYFSQSSYDGYILIDQTGEIIVSDKKNWLGYKITELDTDAFFRHLISRETNIVTSVPNNGGALASYNSLIKMGHSVFSDSDEYLGSFILLYNPQLRFTNVLNGGRIGTSGESYAFNRLGEMISESRFDNELIQIGLLKEGEKSQLNILLKDPGADLTTGSKPALNKNEQAFTFMASEAMKGYSGVNTSGYNDYRGVKVIGVWSWVEKYGFGITTEIDYKEAFKTLILIKKLNSYSGLSFIILLFVLTGFFIFNRIRLSYLNQEMDKQTSLLSSLLNSIPDLIFYKDKKSVYMGANKAFENLVAKKVSEFVDQTDEALFPKEIASVFIENDQKMLAEGSTRFNEEEVTYPDGRIVMLETLKTPFYSNEGELLGLIGISRDITERKLMEERIKASENKFRSITATATDAILSTGQTGLIESWNKAAIDIFGYTEEEAMGKPIQLIIPEEYHDAHIKGMQRVLYGGKKKVIGRTIELKGKKKDGTIFPIDLALSSWIDQGQMKFSGIIRDVSERKKYQEAIEQANTRMSNELNVAKEIQMSMLPLIFPALPNRKEIDVYAYLLPAREVGGDFYDFFFIDEDHLCFTVGDVAGKGVPAALMMAVCITLIKSNAQENLSTASILAQVNSVMAADNVNAMFVTVFIAILNVKTGELTFSNAGHNPTYIKRKDGSLQKLKELHGVVIAAMEGLPYKESKTQLQPGDIVFAYTDGIPEAHNSKEEMYSDGQLESLIAQHEFKSARHLVDEMIDSVLQFEGDAEQFDDITALCIQYKGG